MPGVMDHDGPTAADLVRYVLMRHYRWTWEQVAAIPDHLLIAVLDA